MNRLGLRVDVDTIEGLVHGLPVLLRILANAGVRATIFLPMGPDVPSLTLARIGLRRERIQQMIRLRPAGGNLVHIALAGLISKTRLFYRFLTPYRSSLADHELALHGYDHWRWIFSVHRWSIPRIITEIKRGCDRFETIFGYAATGFGAPGWRTTPAALTAMDTFNFSYASDCRGRSPFLPQGHSTPQIPATLPTIEEALRSGTTDEMLFQRDLLECLGDTADNCYCAHCETEGIRFPSFFGYLISQALERGIAICPLSELIPDGSISSGTVGHRRIRGRFEPVAWQEETHRT